MNSPNLNKINAAHQPRKWGGGFSSSARALDDCQFQKHGNYQEIKNIDSAMSFTTFSIYIYVQCGFLFRRSHQLIQKVIRILCHSKQSSILIHVAILCVSPSRNHLKIL